MGLEPRDRLTIRVRNNLYILLFIHILQFNLCFIIYAYKKKAMSDPENGLYLLSHLQ